MLERSLLAALVLAAGACGGAEGEVGSEALGLATVSDQAVLDVRFTATGGTELWSAGAWITTDGTVEDQISGSNSVAAVSTRFQPAAGQTIRMRFRVGTDPWSEWSGWTTGRITRTQQVPAAGASAQEDFQIDVRGSAAPTCPCSGYIRVKKLNSG